MMRRNYNEEVTHLLKRQFYEWDTVRDNYNRLSQADIRKIQKYNFDLVLQYNPERIHSAIVNIDLKTISQRPCFLCNEYQPSEQQAVMWEGRYKIQVNPYPIFKRHLTISTLEHTNQRIEGRIGDMMQIAKDLQDYVILYNGAQCGASAPDHMHFQAGLREDLPICNVLPRLTILIIYSNYRDCFGYNVNWFCPVFFISTPNLKNGEEWLSDLINWLPVQEGQTEPMINILCWYKNETWYVAAFPRSNHRPSCYGCSDGQFIISPAAAELGGLWPIAREKDFKKITFHDVECILSDVCLSIKEIGDIARNLRDLLTYYSLNKTTNYGTSSPS